MPRGRPNLLHHRTCNLAYLSVNVHIVARDDEMQPMTMDTPQYDLSQSTILLRMVLSLRESFVLETTLVDLIHWSNS